MPTDSTRALKIPLLLRALRRLGVREIRKQGANDVLVKHPSTNRQRQIKVSGCGEPRPAGGGRRKLALEWWIPKDISANAFAFVDVEGESGYLKRLKCSVMHSNIPAVVKNIY